MVDTEVVEMVERRRHPMSVEQIYEALGLENYVLFLERITTQNRERFPELLGSGPETEEAIKTRGTGRTTRMLCTALSELSAGEHVLLAARTMHHAHLLHRDLFDWANRLGISTSRLLKPIVKAGNVCTFDDTTWSP